MEIQTTPKITKIMLSIGVVTTWFAVAFLSEPFVGHAAAPKVALWAAFTFWGFAFHLPRQGSLISFVVGLAGFGTGYYQYVRQDTVGLLVAGTAVVIAGAIALTYRQRRVLKEQPRLPKD